MSYKLINLTSDRRLARLFLSKKQPCALQLWVLQIKTEGGVENRVLYGRLLPYSFSNNSWSSSDRDESQSFGSFRASVTKLNLYIDSSLCSDFLRMICEGMDINTVSGVLNLNVPAKLSEKFGSTVISDQYATFRPVRYLLNRDANNHNLLLSPHAKASALSASIVKNDKKSLLYFSGNYYKDLTSMIVNQLNSDTGMNFGGKDISRLGDIELLVFPALDNNERNLLVVSLNKNDGTVNVRFDSSKLPGSCSYQFFLAVENDNQIIYSKAALAKSFDSGIFECTFELDDKTSEIVDSVRVDVFYFQQNNLENGELCCSWKCDYIREVNLQTHVISNNTSPVKFDWLEKNTAPQMVDRVSHVLSFSARNHFSQSKIGGRIIDKWVPENNSLSSLFTKLYPRKSDGRFFPRLGPSNGEGRLQFVEWFKELVSKHKQRHIAIFDPYFEDVGLTLLLLNAFPGSEYTIFRSMPKLVEKGVPQRRKTDGLINRGLDNLIANCKHNERLLRSSNVKIYGMKDGRLHDRYILVLDSGGLPVEGFHLSNSFQKATANNPLLITPIPTDVLYQTNQYVFDIIQEANISSDEESNEKKIFLLFDSKNSSSEKKLYEPFDILNKALAGTVLSVWLKEPLLKGLCGFNLKSKMNELGLIQGESLHHFSKNGLLNCLNEMEGELSDFIKAWEIIGDILAHTIVDDSSIDGIQTDKKFLTFLLSFLTHSFKRTAMLDEQEITVIDPIYFNMSLDNFIHSSTQTYHFHHAIKHKVITWSEFYAVKYLWLYSPDSLLGLSEAVIKELGEKYQPEYVIILSLLEQVVGEISLSVEFNTLSREQIASLMKSNIAMMNWFGWNGIETQLIAESKSGIDIETLPFSSFSQQVQFLGWVINRNAHDESNSSFYKNALNFLHTKLLPEKLSGSDFELLINALRGHMHQLGWAEPWLFRDIVEPLLRERRVSFEDVSNVWFVDFMDLLNKKRSGNAILFSSKREGVTTDLCSYFLAHSNPDYQKKCLKKLTQILDKQKAIIQQPLASTSNWSKWDDALTISLWVLIFAKLGKYYLERKEGATYQLLESVSEYSTALIGVRNKDEWRHHDELFSCLEKVEKLVNSRE